MGFDWEKHLRIPALKHMWTTTTCICSNKKTTCFLVTCIDRTLSFNVITISVLLSPVKQRLSYTIYLLFPKRSPLIQDPLHPFVSRISRVMELFSSPIVFIWEIRYYYKQSNSNSLGKDVMLYEHSIIRANLRH